MTARAVLALALVLAGCSATPSTSGSPGTSAQVAATDPASPSATPSSAAMSPTAAPEPEPLAWSRLDAPGPAAREDHTWTAAGDGGTAILFGGRDGATVFGDLWAYDLEADSWTELSPTPGPAARFGHEAAWVENVGLVVFAGQAGATFFNDLWAYDSDADAWTELPGSGDVPVSRYGTCAAIGPDGRLWISHGFTSEQARFSDTRTYDFDAATWTDVTPGGTRPVERCLHGCWWTDDGALALYAGQTTGTLALADGWALADGEWSEIAGTLPPERNLYARARVDDGTLVFGGQALDGSYRGDLWILPDAGGDAVALEPDGERPPGRAGAEMVTDPSTDRVLLFGGRDANGGLADIWSLAGVGVGG
jgi:Galactose oxidase, central domain